MKAQQREAKVLEDKIKGAQERLAQSVKAKGNGFMLDTTFSSGVDAAYASYYREQEMRAERAKGATEQARLAKELARISCEIGMANGPPRRGDRYEVPRERSELPPRQRGRDDEMIRCAPRSDWPLALFTSLNLEKCGPHEGYMVKVQLANGMVNTKSTVNKLVERWETHH